MFWRLPERRQARTQERGVSTSSDEDAAWRRAGPARTRRALPVDPRVQVASALVAEDDDRIAALLHWYEAHGRDLPWRRTHDPYAILVSEVMLQQTQVARVLERWPAWLERWPTAEALAAASTADVLRAWSGLGYNRRALNLQRAARAVVERGGFPRDVDGLRQLPGVGPYTASAVACFAFGAQLTTVDTNARRVFQRAFGRDDVDPPAGRAYAFNQALFDVGATLCLARVPRCEACPLAFACQSRGRRFEPERRQGPLAGSRRQKRAALLRDLHAGPRSAAGYDADVIATLVRDGLVLETGPGLLVLPEEDR
jgi:A/G-specific adenine glycosylase